MRSVFSKFLVASGIAALAFAGFTLFRAWNLVHRHATEMVALQAELAVEFSLGIRQYMGETVRPIALERCGPDEFIPELMSTSFAARGVFDRVRKRFPDYIIKFASDNPRNPINAAGPEEQAIIRYFQENPRAMEWTGHLHINGTRHYVRCAPMRVTDHCLRCHGRPQDAPKSLLARYGGEAGFHRALGDVVAIETVGIPTETMTAKLAAESLQQFAVLCGAIIALFTAIVWLFRWVVTRRLTAIAQHLMAAADQANDVLPTPVPVTGRDEIGVLASSFNRLAQRLQALHDTQQRQLKALQESEQRLELALQGGELGFWDWEIQSGQHFVNERWAAMLGCKLSEVQHDIGAWKSRIHPDDAARVFETLQGHLDSGGEYSLDFRMRSADGRWVWVHSQGKVVEWGPDGKPSRMIGIHQDVTGRKEAEIAMAEAMKLADDANRAKSEFLANMSHEIRTPMTAILGYIDLLAEHCARRCSFNREGIGDPLEIISHNARHLLCIIDDVLDLSKIEAGKVAVACAACSPREIIAEVTALIRSRAADKGVSLETEFVGAMPVSIQSDPVRLRQILLNLVGNAIKFTDTGSVRVVARLKRSQDRQPLLQIQVIDTGIGIPEELVGKLFQPFTQADASTSRRFGGTGLGLAISQRLAHLLGGQISVTSAVGKGSTFTVQVPTGSHPGLEPAGLPRDAEFPSADQDPRPTGEAPGLLGCRVLLAEDGPDTQTLIAFLLRKAGAEVCVADDGRFAVEAAERAQRDGQPFDIILMDMQMPVMDGYEATRKLRAARWTTPIVALTAHALTEDRQKCLDAGCDDYAAKPIDRQTLLDIVDRWVTRRRAAGQSKSICSQRR